MFGSFLPGLGWFAPPKSIRESEPTLLWNQFHSSTPGAGGFECYGLWLLKNSAFVKTVTIFGIENVQKIRERRL